MRWQNRFDRLLKAMVAGEPHKAKPMPPAAHERQDDKPKNEKGER
jgi:hypothetical protein